MAVHNSIIVTDDDGDTLNFAPATYGDIPVLEARIKGSSDYVRLTQDDAGELAEYLSAWSAE